MTIINYLYLYLLTVPIVFFIDILWLGIIAKDFYQSRLADFLGPINWTASIVFYLIYIVGVIIFATAPALDTGSVLKAALLGAMFGFFAYATYDLTNLATLKNWPVSIVLVDIIWGTLLTSVVATLSYLIAKTWLLP